MGEFGGRKGRLLISDFTLVGDKLKYDTGVVCYLCITPTSRKDVLQGPFFSVFALPAFKEQLINTLKILSSNSEPMRAIADRRKPTGTVSC